MDAIRRYSLSGNVLDLGSSEHGIPTAISYSSGVIGDVANFNGSTSVVSIPEFNMNRNSTVAFWYYFSGASLEMPFGKIDVNNYFGFTKDTRYMIQDHGNVNIYWNTAPKNNEWTHVALVRKGDLWEIFVSGLSIGTQPVVNDFFIDSIGNGYTGTTYAYTGQLADFRVYDYALTKYQIQHLAKANILSYDFADSNMLATKNLSPYPRKVGYSAHPYTHEMEYYSIKAPNGLMEGSKMTTIATGQSRIEFTTPVPLVDTEYTFSVYGKRGSTPYIGLYTYLRPYDSPHVIADLDQGIIVSEGAGIRGSSLEYVNDGWWRISMVTILRTDQLNQIYKIVQTANPTSPSVGSVGDHVYYWGAQLETGNRLTDFSDSERSKDIYDYSGLTNDAIIDPSSRPTWSPEAPVGVGSYIFGNSTPTLVYNDINQRILSTKHYGGKQFTTSVWIKHESLATGYKWPIMTLTETNYTATAPSYQILLCIQNNKPQIHMWGGLDPSSAVSTDDNEWHHVAVSYDYDTRLINMYVDGIKAVADYDSAESGMSVNSNFRWQIGSNPRGYPYSGDVSGYKTTFQGSISKPMVFSTILTDQEILNLYQDKFIMDRQGTMYSDDIISHVESTVNLIDTDLYLNSTSHFTVENYDDVYIDRPICRRLTRTSETNAYYSYTGNEPSDENTHYTYSFYVRLISAVTEGNSLYAYLSDNLGAPTQVTSPTVQLAYKWQKVEVTLLTSPGTTYIDRVAFHTLTTGIKLGTVFEISNPQLEKKDHSTPFVDGGRMSELPSEITFVDPGFKRSGIIRYDDYSTVGITDGLVGYWLFDQNTNDYSGNDNHGTPINVLNVQDGYEFDGSTSYVDCGTPEDLKLNLGGTISAFVKMDSFNGTSWSNTIMGKGTSSWANHHYILFKPSGEECFIFSVSDGTTSMASSGPRTGTLQLDVWYHIVATWDKTTKKIYTNGILDQSISSTIMPSASASYVSIGKTGNNGYYFDGIISNVKVFNRPLSAEEIKLEYNTMFKKEYQVDRNNVLYTNDLKQI